MVGVSNATGLRKACAAVNRFLKPLSTGDVDVHRRAVQPPHGSAPQHLELPGHSNHALWRLHRGQVWIEDDEGDSTTLLEDKKGGRELRGGWLDMHKNVVSATTLWRHKHACSFAQCKVPKRSNKMVFLQFEGNKHECAAFMRSVLFCSVSHAKIERYAKCWSKWLCTACAISSSLALMLGAATRWSHTRACGRCCLCAASYAWAIKSAEKLYKRQVFQVFPSRKSPASRNFCNLPLHASRGRWGGDGLGFGPGLLVTASPRAKCIAHQLVSMQDV